MSNVPRQVMTDERMIEDCRSARGWSRRAKSAQAKRVMACAHAAHVHMSLTKAAAEGELGRRMDV